jgi:hypothetical protein
MLDCFNFYEYFSRKEMLRVDAQQGAPRDGNSSLELFKVIISLGLLWSLMLREVQ